MRLHRRLLSIAALALAGAAAPTVASAAVVDRTPGITSVSPAFGTAAGGNSVRISTRSVSPGPVTFGGVPAASGPSEIAVGDDFENGIAYYSFKVQVPAGVAGSTVDVKVGSSGGVSATSDDYTYTAPNAAAPGIDRVIGVAKGPVAGGNRVTVHVFGPVKPTAELWFGSTPGTETLVSVNGISCIPEDPRPCPVADPAVTGWLVSAVAPAAAAAGSVDLSVRSGNIVLGGRTSSSDDYLYEAPPVPVNTPTVASLGGGPVFAGFGGFITIRGTNLGGLKSVKVGSRSAVVLSSSATQILAYAPAQGKGSYAVTVTTRVGTATAPTKLVYRSLF